MRRSPDSLEGTRGFRDARAVSTDDKVIRNAETMSCTACGVQHEPAANFCFACGAAVGVPASAPAVSGVPRSGMATASLVLGLASVTFGFTAVPEVLAVVFGLLALRRIRARPELSGRGSAILGVVLGLVAGPVWIVAVMLDIAPQVPEGLALVLGVVALVRMQRRPGLSGIAAVAIWLGLLIAPIYITVVALMNPPGPQIIAPVGAPYRYTAPYDYSPTTPQGPGRYRTALTHECGYFVAPQNCYAAGVEVAVLPAPPLGSHFQSLLARRLQRAKSADRSLTYAGTFRTPAGPAYRFDYRLIGGPTRADMSDYWIPIPGGQAIRVECSPTPITQGACGSLLRTLHTRHHLTRLAPT